MRKSSVLFGVLFLFCLSSSWLKAEELEEAPEVNVRAKSLRLHDEVSYSPHSVSIEQPASDVYLGETLGKLPGILVRNTSGFGSVTTVITSGALGAGSTAVSIDDIPLLNPSGRGINFSLFPSTLIGGVEHLSPFYSNYDPTAATLVSPGGRINLKTLDRPKSGEIPWSGSVLLGTAKTAEVTAAYRGGDEKRDWVAGAAGFTTKGDYHFEDEKTGQSFDRQHNRAYGGGALGKHRWRLSNGAKLEVLDFFSASDRKNPARLDAPNPKTQQTNQKDVANFIGAKYIAPKALSERDGLFSKAANSYTNTKTRNAFSPTRGTDLAEQTTLGTYGQIGYIRKDEQTSFTIAFDDQYDYMRDSTGIFNRNLFGTTATLTVDMDKFRVVPLARQEAASNFSSAGDGSITVLYMPDANNDIALSYGLLHMYPSFNQIAGFNAGGFVVLPNSSLSVQRDSIVNLTYSRRNSKYTIFSSAFYDLIKNRPSFTTLSPTTSQFVNVPEAGNFAYILDAQYFATQKFSIRGSGTLGRAYDRQTKVDLPFKPRVEAFGSASYLITSTLGITLQEQFVGKRLTGQNQSTVDSLSPFMQTNLRFDANVWKGVAFFKIANLFDAAGSDYPGNPYPGRSAWLGYTFGQGGI